MSLKSILLSISLLLAVHPVLLANQCSDSVDTLLRYYKRFHQVHHRAELPRIKTLLNGLGIPRRETIELNTLHWKKHQFSALVMDQETLKLSGAIPQKILKNTSGMPSLSFLKKTLGNPTLIEAGVIIKFRWQCQGSHKARVIAYVHEQQVQRVSMISCAKGQVCQYWQYGTIGIDPKTQTILNARKARVKTLSDMANKIETSKNAYFHSLKDCRPGKFLMTAKTSAIKLLQIIKGWEDSRCIVIQSMKLPKRLAEKTKKPITQNMQICRYTKHSIHVMVSRNHNLEQGRALHYDSQQMRAITDECEPWSSQ